MHVTYRQTCRACGSSALAPAVDLGMQYLQGSFFKPGKEVPPMRKLPLSLVRCDPMRDQDACGLLQMSSTTPPEILYAAYWYRSGTNRTMQQHLAGVVDEAISLLGRVPARVLDIGCNDGTLLGNYPEATHKFGVDPSDIMPASNGNTTYVRDIFPSDELQRVAQATAFDIITSIAMFYDLEEPVSFVDSIRSQLAEDGLWVFEMSYMPTMLQLTMYDTICQEHLEYYSLAVVEFILRKAGMKLIRASLNSINGGSIRCIAAHRRSSRRPAADDASTIAALHKSEFEMELDTDTPYAAFRDCVVESRDHLRYVLFDLKRQGKRIHAYGASTKGNTILQYCELDNSIIDYAAERSPEKYGARTLGSDIPIISEEESRALRPDYYLVLPWHFREEFVERERKTLESGVRMIFPLPRLEIVEG